MASSDSPNSSYPMKGSCGCGLVKYTLHAPPIWIHCCHCTECQVQTGSAFALNGLIEHNLVTHDSTGAGGAGAGAGGQELEMVPMPAAASGGGQMVARCPSCKTAIWSTYAGIGPLIRFVRLGTLDKDPTPTDGQNNNNPHEKGHLEPDVHIFTGNKVPWLSIPEGKLAFREFYDWKTHWREEAWGRFVRVMQMKEGEGREELIELEKVERELARTSL